MQTIKTRKGKRPPLAILKIDGNSGYVCNFHGSADTPSAPQADDDDLPGWRIPDDDRIDKGLM